MRRKNPPVSGQKQRSNGYLLKLSFLFGFFLIAFLPSSFPATTGQASNAYHAYLKALVLESQGNFVSARQEMEKALVAAPGSAYLQRTAAELYLHLGDLDKAATAIENANRLDPNDSKALILAGQIYWAQKDTARAEAKLREAVKLDPDGTEALMSLASALTPRDPEKAVKLYQDFLERHPGEVDVQEQLAQLYQSMGQLDKAKSAWEKSLELSPTSLRSHLALAQLAEINHDTATAIGHYDAVLAEDPSNLPLLLRVGELRYRNDDMAQAYEAFSKAQAISPNSASANFWLALLAEHRGDWKEAIRLLKQVDTKTHDPGIALRLSYYYSQIGQYREAIRILKGLSDSDPSNPDFLNYLAIAYEENNQFSRAGDVLKRLIELDPKDPENHFHLATLYDRTNNFPKAEAELKQAIALKPDYHVALNYLGYSYAERGVDLAHAEQLVNNAIALDPDNGAYLDSMGWVYYKQGKLKKAEDFLREASLRTKDSLVWDHLGQVLLSQGNVEDAILAWDESLRINPQEEGVAKKVRQAVAKLSPKEKLDLFMKRAIANFGDIKSINGFAQVQVCERKPCFESKVNFSYAREEQLRVEVPGPLSGPLMLLTKPYGRPSDYGAIHPLLQTVGPEVTRAFDRIESLISADLFRDMDLGQMENSIQQKGGLLSARSDNTLIRFQEDGTIRDIEWTNDKDHDVLRLERYGDSKSYALPTRFEWEDINSRFILRLDLLHPSTTLSSNGESEEDPD